MDSVRLSERALRRTPNNGQRKKVPNFEQSKRSDNDIVRHSPDSVEMASNFLGAGATVSCKEGEREIGKSASLKMSRTCMRPLALSLISGT